MISIADTRVSRKQNLYRFQVDSYPKYDILRLYENKGRKGRENTVKTIYDEKGFAYLASLETGEILREKTASEIKKSVDRYFHCPHPQGHARDTFGKYMELLCNADFQ